MEYNKFILDDKSGYLGLNFSNNDVLSMIGTHQLSLKVSGKIDTKT